MTTNGDRPRLELRTGGGQRAVTAADAVRSLHRLTMSDLAEALGLWPGVALPGFACPNRGANDYGHYVDVDLFDKDLWFCRRCETGGTRWTLERLVREDRKALDVVVGWLEAEVA